MFRVSYRVSSSARLHILLYTSVQALNLVHKRNNVNYAYAKAGLPGYIDLFITFSCDAYAQYIFMYSIENMNKIWFVTRLKLFVRFILSSKPSRMYRHFYGCLNSLISAKGFNWIKYLRNAFLLHFQLKPPRMRNLGTVKSPSTIQNFPLRKAAILYVPYVLPL